jgi:hypothetical protein
VIAAILSFSAQISQPEDLVVVYNQVAEEHLVALLMASTEELKMPSQVVAVVEVKT